MEKEAVVKVVIPSHKRAGRVTTLQVVPQAILCVEESQAEEYRKAYPGVELLIHPDSVAGLPRKRDWIYRAAGNVLMLDDDISAMMRLYTEPGERAEVYPDEAWDIIQSTAAAALDAGVFLWGFNSNPNPMMYTSPSPIKLTGYITGCATGLLAGSKLFYNPAIVCNEDYWISLLNAHYHRMIWKDMRFTFIQKDTFKNPGGLAEFRNLDREKIDFDLLRRYFGDAVELRKTTGKMKHPYQKMMRVGF